MKPLSAATLTALRVAAVLAFLIAVAAGLIAKELHTKILLSALAAVTAGLLGAIALRLAETIEPTTLKQADENVREAQRMLNEISRRWRPGFVPVVDPASFSLMETLRQPLFIFT